MSMTAVEIDDLLLEWVMNKYRLPTKREAVDYALRRLHIEPLSLEEALAMQGTGWDGDLDEMRSNTGRKISGDR